MQILIAAGGTGGHFYPAIAIGEAFKSHGIDVVFVGRKGSLEEKKYTEYGFPVRLIHASQFDFKPRLFFLFLLDFFKGISDSFGLMKTERIDVVIGCGGYVSAPVIFSSIISRKPYFLYEQNIIPGRANKVFKHFAKKVFLGFKDEYKFFGGKGVFTGNPIREKMSLLNRGDALHLLGLKNLPTLFVFGGSGGSNKINRVFSSAIPEIIKKVNIQIVFVTGERMYEEISNTAKFTNVKVLPYIEEIQLAYSVADLALTRAGAMTLTELAYYKIPSIVIPFPFATDDHQKKNALYLAKKGCIDVVEENNFTKDLIVDKIVYYFTHMDIIKMMKERFRENIFPENSAELVVREVMNSING